MKERPILFSGPLVRAILDGEKTQTRRVVQRQPLHEYDKGADLHHFGKPIGDHSIKWMVENSFIKTCPYGQAGDSLWVRETHKLWCVDGTGTIDDGCWKVRYRADDDSGFLWDEKGWRIRWNEEGISLRDVGCSEEPKKWRPSIHMPRWVSRITLKVTGVRVERLQRISPDDAKAEGMPEPYVASESGYETEMRGLFRDHWDTFANPGEKWQDNPWVWVIEFKRLEAKP